MNLTGLTLYVAAGRHERLLPSSDEPHTYTPTSLGSRRLVASGTSSPIAEVRIKAFVPSEMELYGVPPRRPSTIYLVPDEVLDACPERDDPFAVGSLDRPQH